MKNCKYYDLNCGQEERTCKGCAYCEKSADEMFEDLCYVKEWLFSLKGEKWGENYINKNDCVEITFDYLDREFCISCTETDDAIYIGMDELKAINKKVEELGWE